MCALAKEEVPGSSVGEHKRGAAVLAPQFYVGRLRRVHELLSSSLEHKRGQVQDETCALRSSSGPERVTHLRWVRRVPAGAQCECSPPLAPNPGVASRWP